MYLYSLELGLKNFHFEYSLKQFCAFKNVLKIKQYISFFFRFSNFVCENNGMQLQNLVLKNLHKIDIQSNLMMRTLKYYNFAHYIRFVNNGCLLEDLCCYSRILFDVIIIRYTG